MKWDPYQGENLYETVKLISSALAIISERTLSQQRRKDQHENQHQTQNKNERKFGSLSHQRGREGSLLRRRRESEEEGNQRRDLYT